MKEIKNSNLIDTQNTINISLTLEELFILTVILGDTNSAEVKELAQEFELLFKKLNIDINVDLPHIFSLNDTYSSMVQILKDNKIIE